LRDQIVPPTLNLDNPSPSCDIDLVPKVARERKVKYVLDPILSALAAPMPR